MYRLSSICASPGAPKDVLVVLQFPGDKTAVPFELSRLDCDTPKALMHGSSAAAWLP